jgi:hypothetical protein
VGDDPALGDFAFGDAEDRDGSPGEGFTAVLEHACGEDHRALIVGEHAAHVDSEGRVGEGAPFGEVTQDLIATSVLACDRGVTRHVPDHIGGEHRTHGFLITAGVEAILVVVEVADQLRMCFSYRQEENWPSALAEYLIELSYFSTVVSRW